MRGWGLTPEEVKKPFLPFLGQHDEGIGNHSGAFWALKCGTFCGLGEQQPSIRDGMHHWGPRFTSCMREVGRAQVFPDIGPGKPGPAHLNRHPMLGQGGELQRDE